MDSKVKKIITIVVVALLAVVVIWKGTDALKSKNVQSGGNASAENQTNAQESDSTVSKKEFPYEIWQGAKTYTSRIEQKQIKSLGTKNLIAYQRNDYQAAVDVQVDMLGVSRELPDGYTVDEIVAEMFGNDIMSADGTFLKDFYYVNVHINLVNQGDKPTRLVPRSLNYIFIDKDLDAWDISQGGYKYSGRMFNNNAYYYRETGDSNLLDTSPSVREANKGEGCEYDACYIISDEMYEDNQMYFEHSFGMKPDESFEDKNQLYIKCDLK